MKDKDKIDDGGLVFPKLVQLGSAAVSDGGLSRRDWFATFAPAPTHEQIVFEYTHDKNANVHGDSYKPPRRGELEILTDLRYKFADAMILASTRKPRGSE